MGAGTAAAGDAAGGGGLAGREGPPGGAGVQKDMVTSDTEEGEISSWDKERIGTAAEADVAAADTGPWGYPPGGGGPP